MGRGKARGKRKTFELLPVYDDPDHELVAPPDNTLGGGRPPDFLFMGDDLSWGFSHEVLQEKFDFDNQVDDKGNLRSEFVIEKDENYHWTNELSAFLKEHNINFIENNMINRTTAYDDLDCALEFIMTFNENVKESIFSTVVKTEVEHHRMIDDVVYMPNEVGHAAATVGPAEFDQDSATIVTSNPILEKPRKKRNRSKPQKVGASGLKEKHRLQSPFDPYDFNGAFHFGTFFSSHSPMYICFMLGTHDLKKRTREMHFNLHGHKLTAGVVAENISNIIKTAEVLFTAHCHYGSGSVFTPVNSTLSSTNVLSQALYTLSETSSIHNTHKETLYPNAITGNPRLKAIVICPPRIKLTKISKALGFDEESVQLSEALPFALKKMCVENGHTFVYFNLSMEHSVDGIHMTQKGCQRLAEKVISKLGSFFPNAEV